MPVKVSLTYNNKINSKRVSTEKKLFKELEKQGEKILKTAKDKYVPVQTGALKESGKVEAHEPIRNGTSGYDQAKVDITFGNEDVNYALSVHEAPPDWGQGKNKYLTNAINDHAPIMGDEIAQELTRWLR